MPSAQDAYWHHPPDLQTWSHSGLHGIHYSKQSHRLGEDNTHASIHDIISIGGLTVAQVTVLQFPSIRDAVADDLIDGRATRLGEIAVVERGRVTVPFHARFMDHSIYLICGHSRPHHASTYIQHLPTQLQASRQTQSESHITHEPTLTRHATWRPSISGGDNCWITEAFFASFSL